MTRKRGRGWRFESTESLESRLLMAAPVIDTIADVSVPVLKTRVIPITASDADGDTLTYSVQSNGTAFTSRVIQNTVDLKLTVANYGDLVFKLVPEFAPKTVSQIVSFVQSGYYDGLSFHRVISNFMIQGGDPAGDGTGGPGFQFDDEFNPDAIFSGYGQLAMANSGKDTNGSQFFVTTSSPRYLDFNHTIFGQLVRGFDVLNAIQSTSTNSSDRPVVPVVITHASVFTNTTDALLLLDSSVSGNSSITVTASDGTGGVASKTFLASSAADSTNDPPILGPVGNAITAVGKSVAIPLSSIDLEGSPVTYDAAVIDQTPKATIQVVGNVVNVTPTAGYIGDIHLIVGVRQSVSSTRWDTQVITVSVKQQVLVSQGIHAADVEGSAAQKQVGRFTATVPYSASQFSGVINWGAGVTTPGTIVLGSDGYYTVSTNTSKARFGSYPFSVEITDQVSGATSSATGTLTVNDASLDVQLVPITPSAGTRTISGVVAKITDSNPQGVASDLSGTINWGDGSTSAASFVAKGAGVFDVVGTRTYAALGSYPVSVAITSVGGASASTQGSILIPNLHPLIDPIEAKSVSEGSTLSFQVTASDPDAGQSLKFSLGEGAPAGASIDPVSGQFHWTPKVGPALVSINVLATDDGASPLTTTRSFTVKVDDVAPTIEVGPSASLTQMDVYSGSGKFTDPGQGSWTATVNYGDGTGTQPLSLNADHSFVLSHRYATPGAFSLVVSIQDAGLPNAPVSKSTAITVGNVAPGLQIDSSTSSLKQFDLFERSGSVTDLGPETLSISVDYGDGTGRQALALNTDRTFRLSHRYAISGDFSVSVIANDPFGGSASTTIPVRIEARPQVSVVSVSSAIKKGAVNTISLVFDGDLNSQSARTAANYLLVQAGRDKKFGTKDDLITRFKTATLAGRVVSLTPLKRLVLTGNYQLKVSNLRDTYDRSLARSVNGTVVGSLAKSGKGSFPQ